MTKLTCVEICAGAGGQSAGLEKAGFGHTAAVEIDDLLLLRFGQAIDPPW